MVSITEKEERKPKVELQILDKRKEYKFSDTERDSDHTANSAHEDEIDIIEELFQEKAFGMWRRSRPRIWAIKILLWPYFETITMMVILCNGVTLGMYDPYDDKCETERCKTLEVVETCIYSFFVFEMLVKMLAMGIRGKLGYFNVSWNRLDFFIVCASSVEYLYGDGEYLSSIRAARVLRPLRAINKVPSIRILVALLLDTLPMLGNVLAICTLIFVVFGIIGVQLWQGVLRNRCVLDAPTNISHMNLSTYYREKTEYSLICSLPTDNGIVQCNDAFIPQYSTTRFSPKCTESYDSYHNPNTSLTNKSCINWNMYYTKCQQVGDNPYYGAISFDHTGLAIVAIFQVITLEGWSKIMYFLQDAYSPWVWIYFVALIVVGAYFMTNLCLVVIASQFSETRQRESALIEQANRKARLLKSYSTLSGSVSSYTLKDQGCYAAILGIFEDAYKRIRKRLRRRFAGTRFCKAQEKKRRKRKIAKRKEKRNLPCTIHLHHHHHHHFHHHHHICSNNANNSQSDPTESSNLIQPEEIGQRSSLRTPTFVAIDNEYSDPRVGVASVCPLAIQNTALLMPDTTVVICRSRQPSPRLQQATHTVSFYSTSLKDKSSLDDDSPIKPDDSSHDFPNGKQKKTSYCPKVDQLESGVECEKYEEIYKSESSDDEEEEDEEEDIPGCCSRFRSKLRDICESNAFKGLIMGSILLNTVTMGIEHHGQPKELTAVLDIFNLIFTGVFIVEFLLKIIGYGPCGYIKDSFNLFDGTIVIISVVEIFGGDSASGVSVLRTFRLMRIFKLIRFMKSLQKQITVMVKTLDSVMTFLALLVIFIFTVSILGMHLFGAKMILNGTPVRHNFDSLLWALMTTFQVLTQEDWPSVMYDAMRFTSKWAAFYFIILMTLGNYILFNLLVAILVEGFSNDPKLRALIKPKSKLQIKQKNDKQGDEEDLVIDQKTDENMNGVSRKDVYENQYHNNHLLTKCTSRCQRRPSLVRSVSDIGQGSCKQLVAYNAKSKVYSLPDLPSVFPDAACKYATDNSVIACKHHHANFDAEILRPSNSKTSLKPTKEDIIEIEKTFEINEDEDAKTKKAEENCEDWLGLGLMENSEEDYGIEEQPSNTRCPRFKFECLESRQNHSFYIFAPTNGFRRFNMFLCSSKWFDRIILFFIFFNCVVLAMESPDLDPHGSERRFIDITNNIFTFVFLTEMLIKIFAHGFMVGEHTYLKSGWNVMDFFLVVISLVDYFVTQFSEKKSSFLSVLKVFRALRTLRPLRVISRAPGLKLVVETLISSLKPIGNLLVIAGVFFTIFGILGVQIFKGSFYYCFNPTEPVETKAECLLRGGSWRNREYNFDNLLKAMLTLFVFSTKDGWVALMHHGIDAVGVDKQPIKNHNPWAFLYFFSFLLIAGFVVINMVVGVIIDNFHRCRDIIEANDGAQKRFQTAAEHIIDGPDAESEAPLSEPDFSKSSNASVSGDSEVTSTLSEEGNRDISQSLFDTFPVWRRVVYTVVTHFKFDIMIATVIGLNVFFMAIEYYKMPPGLTQFLKIMNFIFTGVFILEALLKILAFGLRTFISERWNQLDVIIVVLSIIGIVLEELNESLPINPTIIRIMRVLRITRVLKILRSAEGIQKLLNCLSQTLPQVGNLSMLFLLLFFIFSSLGMELFGKLDCNRDICMGLNRHAHFRNFGYAMLTLFRISTGDSWSGLMKDTLNTKICTQDCDLLYWVSPIYFAIFVLSTQFVLVNVVVAVLMKQLEDSKESSSSSKCDGISDLDESFSNDSKSNHSEDGYSASLEENSEDRAKDNAQSSNQDAEFDNEDEYKERLLPNDTHGSDIACSLDYNHSKPDYQKQITQETDFEVTPDNDEHFLERSVVSIQDNIDNTVIVISPAHESDNHVSSIAGSLNVPKSLDETSFLGMTAAETQIDTMYSYSMPELSTFFLADCERTLAKPKAYLSFPEEIRNLNDGELTSECVRKASVAPFQVRRRSSSKVAPLNEAKLVHSHQNLALDDSDNDPYDIVQLSISKDRHLRDELGSHQQ